MRFLNNVKIIFNFKFHRLVNDLIECKSETNFYSYIYHENFKIISIINKNIKILSFSYWEIMIDPFSDIAMYNNT
jgi:hypothetical protein